MPRILLLLLIVAGCLPPDDLKQPKLKIDPDIDQLVHVWRVADHVLPTKTSQSDRDATELHGRTVTIGAASYTTPWHGTCEEANRERRTRAMVEIVADFDLSVAADATVRKFGLVEPVVEYRMSCRGNTRTPALTIFVGGPRAMTCFSGACYLLSR